MEKTRKLKIAQRLEKFFAVRAALATNLVPLHKSDARGKVWRPKKILVSENYHEYFKDSIEQYIANISPWIDFTGEQRSSKREMEATERSELPQ